MDPTVSDFYTKNPAADYMAQYEFSHGPRLDAIAARYDLKSLRGRVLDVGGGLGFLGKRLDPSVDYWVIDGAEITEEQRLCKGTWIKADLDHDEFSRHDASGFGPTGQRDTMRYTDRHLGSFQTAFCLETLEHLFAPYHCLVEIKKLVKLDGIIYLSVPPISVWHNVVYPALLWPPENFMQFLGQMALPITDFWEYKPTTVGWPAYTFRCINRPWSEKKLMFEKQELKFRDASPLECTNL